jgi:hypothetical protein
MLQVGATGINQPTNQPTTALVGLGRFFGSLIYTQSVGLLGRGISSSQGRYLNTE